jgi:hypothetical protein
VCCSIGSLWAAHRCWFHQGILLLLLLLLLQLFLGSILHKLFLSDFHITVLLK